MLRDEPYMTIIKVNLMAMYPDDDSFSPATGPNTELYATDIQAAIECAEMMATDVDVDLRQEPALFYPLFGLFFIRFEREDGTKFKIGFSEKEVQHST